MLAKSVLIRGESLHRFNCLLAMYHAIFKPRNAVEKGLVDTLVEARWGQMRFESIDTAAINLEIDRQSAAPVYDAPTRAHLAILTLAGKTAYNQAMRRYIGLQQPPVRRRAPTTPPHAKGRIETGPPKSR
jgi:hypothetical protein